MIQNSGAAYRYVHRGTLQPPQGFDSLVSASVGADGNAVTLWSSAADRAGFTARVELANGVTFPTTRMPSTAPAAFVVYSATDLRPVTVTTVSDLPVSHPKVQSLPDGGFVAAGTRCMWSPEGPEHNAFVFDADGRVVRTGTIGDGISHLLADDDGALWAGYFDEGVCGNFGWSGPGPVALGAAGLVKWSLTSFEPEWEYESPSDIPPRVHSSGKVRYHMVDCYTLNLPPHRDGTRTVWACPYPHFPLIAIEQQDDLHPWVAVWPTADVSLPSGLVVAEDTVAFVGSYRNAESLMVGSIEDPTRLIEARLSLPTANSERRPLVCRGSRAHMFVGTDWFVFDLEDRSSGSGRT